MFFFLQVLADQAVWAVCGRAAGVIEMEDAKKQTLIVEVMPLAGGHLPLPKVRLSKYNAIEATASRGQYFKFGAASFVVTNLNLSEAISI